MAFSADSIHLILIVALAFSFLNHNHNFVEADEGLIEDTCRNTDVPELCKQCLDSIPGSEGADVKGIATNVVECVSNHAKFLQSNMSDLISKGGIDKGLKTTLKNCTGAYSTATKKNLFKVGARLTKGDYGGANQLISMAQYIQLECRENLESNHMWNPEPNIIYDMNSYDELSIAAMRIIDRI